jgi:hypothetical protein
MGGDPIHCRPLIWLRVKRSCLIGDVSSLVSVAALCYIIVGETSDKSEDLLQLLAT